MKRLEEVLTELGSVERAEVMTWIEAEWVRPESAAAEPLFRPVDIARLRLIHELRHDLAIDQEAMPVVLSLIDEMYTLRRRLAALTRAIGETPDDIRRSLFARCRVLIQPPDDESAA